MPLLTDVVIIGGGAIGLGIAWRLAQRGARVAVIDRGPMAGEASSHAAGMLVPLGEAEGPGPFLDLCQASNGLYPVFADELRAAGGVDIEYVRGGMYQVVFDESARAGLARRFEWLRTLPLNVEALDADALRVRAPNVSPEARSALFMPSEGWLTPPRFAQALAAAAAGAGVRVLPDRPLSAVEREGPWATAVRAGGKRLAAGRFVIAAGPWSGEVGERFGCPLPVFPARGQLVALDGADPPVPHVVYGKGVYTVPWRSGELIVGSTVERVGFRKEVTAGGVAGLLRAAVELVPALAGRPLRRMWACLRPGTPDGLPILGRVPGLDNVFVATGHFRNGILLTPITATLMADLILDKPPDLSLHPFRLDRPSLSGSEHPA